jgi:hypothetical protein
MKKFTFASVRGEDFVVFEENIENAFKNLCEEEKDNGVLWRLFDFYRNSYAINNEGFIAYFDMAVKIEEI